MMNLSSSNKKNEIKDNGFTLVEVLAAIGIIAIIIVCFCQVITTSSKISRNSKYKKIASHLLRQKLEELFHYGEADFDQGDIKTNNSLVVTALDLTNEIKDTLKKGGGEKVLTDSRLARLRVTNHTDKPSGGRTNNCEFNRGWIVEEKTSPGQRYKEITCIVEWKKEGTLGYGHICFTQRIYDIDRIGVGEERDGN
ncbi:MAG: prepilin-type N-terminal cleavage/methylation domain-containing protein [bacterium]